MLRQGQLEQAVCDCIQMGFEYLQGHRLHNIYRQFVPAFDHPHSEKKKTKSKQQHAPPHTTAFVRKYIDSLAGSPEVCLQYGLMASSNSVKL